MLTPSNWILAEGRRIERPWLITMPRFSRPVADHSAVPSAWRRVRESNPLASCEDSCLANKCLTVRPTLRYFKGAAMFHCCALANRSRNLALALPHSFHQQLWFRFFAKNELPIAGFPGRLSGIRTHKTLLFHPSTQNLRVPGTPVADRCVCQFRRGPGNLIEIVQRFSNSIGID